MKSLSYSIFPILLLASCAKESTDSTGLAARVGAHTLTLEEVQRNTPAGLSSADSLRFVHNYVDNWVEEQAITEMAEKYIPSTEDIDKMVDDYRRQLLMWEYRRAMAQKNGFTQPADSAVDNYYRAHSSHLKLQHPIVKGIYIKIPDNAPELKEIRKLYRSNRIEDFDKLEKLVGKAVNYEYFRDTWTDWESLESRIPAKELANNPDAFPSANKFLDTTNDGYVYLLAISEVLPAGATMPVDYARAGIVEALKRENAVAYDKALRHQLMEEALSEGAAQIFITGE